MRYTKLLDEPDLRISMRTLFFALSLTLIACSESPQQGATETNEKVYVHAMDQAATTTDPVLAATIYDSFLVKNIYDTLFRYQYLARPYQLTTNLASRMPDISEDALTYTIPIKRGVRFHDSDVFAPNATREVTAEDVV